MLTVVHISAIVGYHQGIQPYFSVVMEFTLITLLTVALKCTACIKYTQITFMTWLKTVHCNDNILLHVKLITLIMFQVM
jgi:hypothetical protein